MRLSEIEEAVGENATAAHSAVSIVVEDVSSQVSGLVDLATSPVVETMRRIASDALTSMLRQVKAYEDAIARSTANLIKMIEQINEVWGKCLYRNILKFLSCIPGTRRIRERLILHYVEETLPARQRYLRKVLVVCSSPPPSRATAPMRLVARTPGRSLRGPSLITPHLRVIGVAA